MPKGKDLEWEAMQDFLRRMKAENGVTQGEMLLKMVSVMQDLENGSAVLVSDKEAEQIVRIKKFASATQRTDDKVLDLLEVLKRRECARNGRYRFTKTDVAKIAAKMFGCGKRRGYDYFEDLELRGEVRKCWNGKKPGHQTQLWELTRPYERPQETPETPERAETYEDMDEIDKAILEAKPIIHNRRQSVVSSS